MTTLTSSEDRERIFQLADITAHDIINALVMLHNANNPDDAFPADFALDADDTFSLTWIMPNGASGGLFNQGTDPDRTYRLDVNETDTL